MNTIKIPPEDQALNRTTLAWTHADCIPFNASGAKPWSIALLIVEYTGNLQWIAFFTWQFDKRVPWADEIGSATEGRAIRSLCLTR